MNYAPQRWLYVDVDGTLLVRGEPNAQLVEFLREQKARGFTLVLWSAQGQAHAMMAARECECEDLFEAILSKPGYVVDDKGWGWIRWARVVRNEEDLP